MTAPAGPRTRPSELPAVHVARRAVRFVRNGTPCRAARLLAVVDLHRRRLALPRSRPRPRLAGPNPPRGPA